MNIQAPCLAQHGLGASVCTQMAGTFLPLSFSLHETFQHFPLIPTLEDQYIIKKLILVASGLVIGGAVWGKALIHDAGAASIAERMQSRHQRFRRRFQRKP